MTEDESLDWRSARTYDDLLRLARGFVRGELAAFPGWRADALDEESDALEPSLLAANELGMLTVASQPGRPFGPGHDGRDWVGRAFVGGFASDRCARELGRRAGRAGLLLAVEPAAADAPGFSIPTGLRDGLPYLVLGAGGRAEELEIFLKEAGEAAHEALAGRPFLWLVDPVWGRRDALPGALLAAPDASPA